MNIQEQIAAVKKALAEKQAVIEKNMADAVSKGVTPNEEQEAAIAAAEADIEVLEKNLQRLEKIAAAQDAVAKTAVPAVGDNAEAGAKSAAGESVIVKSNLPPGIGFAQYARAKLGAALQFKQTGSPVSPLDMAKQLGFGDEVQDLVKKATLGTTTDTGFAKPLVEENRLVGEFVELLRNASVFSRLSGYRNVPFNSKISAQLTGGAAQWVGEGKAKPLTNPTYGEVKIGEHKLAAITVYTQELMRRADPAVDVLVRDDLIAATSALIDSTFLDATAGDDTRPAGILNGVTATASTGTTAAQYEADLLTLIQKFVEANLTTDNAYFLMSETRAMQIALLRDALGNTYFPGMSLSGTRNLLGIPVITSQTVGDKIVLVKMSEILVAQDGGVDVSYSDQATLKDGSDTHNLWQENKFAVRVEKFITWAKRRPIAAAYLTY